MKQPTIELFENKKSFGVKKIKELLFSNNGDLTCIVVDTISGDIPMYCYDKSLIFKNQYGNVQGEVKF